MPLYFHRCAFAASSTLIEVASENSSSAPRPPVSSCWEGMEAMGAGHGAVQCCSAPERIPHTLPLSWSRRRRRWRCTRRWTWRSTRRGGECGGGMGWGRRRGRSVEGKRLGVRSLVSVRMRNVLVHSDSSVVLGPRLNLVLGPNGSGKSSFVAALALCLHDDVSRLGKSPNLDDYIRRGESEARITVRGRVRGGDGLRRGWRCGGRKFGGLRGLRAGAAAGPARGVGHGGVGAGDRAREWR
jgi:AAA domain